MERGPAAYLSGLREKYFGEVFLNASNSLQGSSHGAADEEGLNHIARYVESFESRSNEIWLIFHHEGISLSKLIYTAVEVATEADKERIEHEKRVQILRPSKWWHWLKTTEAGQDELRNLIRQLVR